MATITDKRATTATLTSTTVDVHRLTQPWDYIEVTNSDSTNLLTISDDGATNPSAGGEGFDVVPPGTSKVLRARRLNPSADMSGTVVCHEIRVLGDGGGVTVAGLARYPDGNR